MRIWNQKKFLLAIVAAAILPLVLNGCFGKDDECLHEDQRESKMPIVHVFPLKVVADDGFSSYEYSEISAAVDEWNKTTTALLGHPFFKLVSNSVPTGIRNADPNDCNQKVGSEGEFFIVREESDSHWKTIGFNHQIPGATVRCARGDAIEHQIILVNVSLIDQRQIQSVVLHELGHSIGLDHSCQGSGDSPNFKSCGGFTAGHPYHEAVMYPWLSSSVKKNGAPETKTQLQENDKQRTSCLYESE